LSQSKTPWAWIGCLFGTIATYVIFSAIDCDGPQF
jgi:hypothetical protein